MGQLFKYLIELSNIIVIFYTTILIFGIIMHYKTQNFSGKKGEIRIYGVLSGMRNIDAIILGFSFMQIITIIYVAIMKNVDLKLYGTIIALTSAVIILYNIRSIIMEGISLIAQLVAIYFNQMLYRYRIEVGDNLGIQVIQIVLIVFIILFAIYSFLLHIEAITKSNINVRRNKTNEKE